MEIDNQKKELESVKHENRSLKAEVEHMRLKQEEYSVFYERENLKNVGISVNQEDKFLEKVKEIRRMYDQELEAMHLEAKKFKRNSEEEYERLEKRLNKQLEDERSSYKIHLQNI